MRDVACDILDKFLSIMSAQVFEPLKKNQARIAWCKELAETKKFKELDDKMASVAVGVKVLREDVVAKEKVLVTLGRIKANQMSHYVDLEDEVIKTDFDLLKETLTPYTRLMAPLEEIRMIQASLVSQGKLKKLTLPYAEIADAFKQISSHIAQMSEKMDAVNAYAMRSLEKVA